MSYGIIRVQKFQAPAVKAIQFHNYREKESRTNPDIDKTKTSQNIVLVECPDYRAAIAERLSKLETSRAVRKDAVVMAQILVTSGPEFFKDMPLEMQKDFFRHSLDFISKRYGKENILSAVVHIDERTPHMHVDLTPIKNGRLTAKTIFTRSELGNLQTDFANEVGHEWKLQRGENKKEKRYHLSTEEYKLKEKEKELIKQTELISSLTIKVPSIQKEELAPRILNKTFLYTYTETNDMIVERLNKKFEEYKDIINITKELRNTIDKLKSNISKLNNELEKEVLEKNHLKIKVDIYEHGLNKEEILKIQDYARSLKLFHSERDQEIQKRQQQSRYSGL